MWKLFHDIPTCTTCHREKDMKFLVVGFSEQAQKTLEVLLQLEFPFHSYCSVPRQLSEKYTPILPNVSANQQKCDFCIIDLDGIGLSQYDIQSKEKLFKLTNYKPSILISRQSYVVWGRDLLLSKNSIVLSHTHTRQELLDALKHILSVATQQPPAEHSPSQQTMHTFQQERELGAGRQEMGISTAPQESKLASMAERAKFSYRVLSQRWQDFDNYPIVKDLLNIFSQSSPYLLHISDHKLLIDPREGTVILKTLSCVVDYFILISGFQFSAFRIETQSLLDDNYHYEKNRLLGSGYRIYSLNLFIWQIFQEIFPHKLSFNGEGLKIKLKYMPNFTAMRSVPPYMQALSATCLVRAQGFDDLKQRFNYLQEEHINRFFFLVLLTDIVDSSVFPVELFANKPEVKQPASAESSSVSTASTEEPSQNNQGVQKAKKTGFLERLLKKLSF